MSSSVANAAVSRHRLLPEKSGGQAKAEIRLAENWRIAVGNVIEDVRLLAKLSLKEFADRVGRDERQIARWIASTERPQFDALFAVEEFQQPLVIAFARLAGHQVEIETTIHVRRSA